MWFRNRTRTNWFDARAADGICVGNAKKDGRKNNLASSTYLSVNE